MRAAKPGIPLSGGPPPAGSGFSPFWIIIAACLISLLGFGVRSGFGLFLEPMTASRGWDREIFALALAVQNLVWGLALLPAGVLADRYGPAPVLAAGAVLYALGVWGMMLSGSGLALYLTGGLLTGAGIAFSSFSIALAAIARVTSPRRRSLALGLGTAAGSLGQVVFAPLGQGLIAALGWQAALLALALTVLAIIPLAFMLPAPGNMAAEDGPGTRETPPETLSLLQAVAAASRHRGFVLLAAGFFVCGFHVAFIAVHLPAYVSDLGLPDGVGSWALALIGLMNIAGSLLAGAYGQRRSRKYGLAAIYSARALAIAALLMAPKTGVVILLFAAAMGLLWLSTVPLTSGMVAGFFGTRYMATLFGMVFLSHQLGSFTGVWLGGRLYDLYGSYDAMWWAGILLGVLAALLHLPIDERPAARPAAAVPAGG